MSIKKNMKRRMLMVLALAMTVAVLAAGTAHAAAFAINACEPPNRTILTHEPSRYVWVDGPYLKYPQGYWYGCGQEK